MDDIKEKELQREAADDKLIEAAFKGMLDIYLASPHRKKVDIITKAFNFAKQAHKGVRRLSGEPYIMHPIAVARIAVEEMGLGSTSICAALLHDVVEDTDYTVEDIENIFGEKVAMIVDGLTKISGGIFDDHKSAQAENFKKLLLTMSDDIRVILIKICDRLHNMRTLESQPAGLNKIKTELEDLSFRYEHPKDYADIKSKLADTQAQRDVLFESFTKPIRAILDDMGLKYEIKARVKSPYSIWNKMQNKHVTFEEIYDILAVRIIYTPKVRSEEINECFKIYVAISKIYKSHPDRLRDWVNHPKANVYQALHVTLMSKQGKWIEVQIRSDHMDEVAEQGFAAHWKYKEGETEVVDDDSELNNWLSTIKEILDDPQPDAMDFLDTIKLNLFANEIFVFTPKGEIKTMPAGCTVLDFAFQIHTFLGSHCIGAKVNHKLVPLSHRLNSGDQVEVLSSNSQHVQASWMNFVSTAKAKGKITAILRRNNRELQKRGEQILDDWLVKNELEMNTPVLNKLCDLHEMKNNEALFLAIGKRTILLGDNDLNELRSKKAENTGGGWRKFVPFFSHNDKKDDTKRSFFIVGEGFNKKKPVIINEENISTFVFPQCCHPIPGDDILGYIDNKNRIEIHRRDCAVASKLKTSFGNRILDAKWDMHKVMFFDATVQISGIDRKRMLHDVAEVISDKLDVNIHRVTISSNEGIFNGTIELRVHDRSEVRVIMDELRKIEDIKEVLQIL